MASKSHKRRTIILYAMNILLLGTITRQRNPSKAVSQSPEPHPVVHGSMSRLRLMMIIVLEDTLHIQGPFGVGADRRDIGVEPHYSRLKVAA